MATVRTIDVEATPVGTIRTIEVTAYEPTPPPQATVKTIVVTATPPQQYFYMHDGTNLYPVRFTYGGTSGPEYLTPPL